MSFTPTDPKTGFEPVMPMNNTCYQIITLKMVMLDSEVVVPTDGFATIFDLNCGGVQGALKKECVCLPEPPQETASLTTVIGDPCMTFTRTWINAVPNAPCERCSDTWHFAWPPLNPPYKVTMHYNPRKAATITEYLTIAANGLKHTAEAAAAEAGKKLGCFK
jgi:hypothetical protein